MTAKLEIDLRNSSIGYSTHVYIKNELNPEDLKALRQGLLVIGVEMVVNKYPALVEARPEALPIRINIERVKELSLRHEE